MQFRRQYAVLLGSVLLLASHMSVSEIGGLHAGSSGVLKITLPDPCLTRKLVSKQCIHDGFAFLALFRPA
jgi:hypothetical protein